ncbi:MAG: hypothetical protein OXI88_23185 [Gammaproteobacteria bacterium]|nr:hypothetical protein [Gammaproteobacteria bacterium]MDE0514673.1 hypothetical protein [Gammaproteobacteria bacterium]
MITKDQQETEYLKEALRLAELRLEEQNTTLTLQEKKAALVVTLCIAIIGYLLTFTGDIQTVPVILDYLFKTKFGDLWTSLIFKILPSLILAFAMVHSIRSLNLMDLGTRGASPGYSMSDYFERDLNNLAKGLLEDYHERIIENQDMLEHKKKEMKSARKWLFIGIPVAIVLVATREMLLAVEPSIL